MKTGAAQILSALRESGDTAVSGEALSDRLGVSRAQVWKHVGALRNLGYQIEGERGGGYCLAGSPDRLYAEEIQAQLQTRWLGRPIEHLEETASTNQVAFDLARAGADAGTAVIAEQQSAGRGRLGRAFYSPSHLNLYTSIVLRPQGAISETPTLILGAAVAVAEAVAEEIGDVDAVEIKWPNDVLIRGRKTSGILMESSAEGSRIAFAILGIGVNLNVDPADFPDEFRAHATSVGAETGRQIDRIGFTRLLFERLEFWLDAHARSGFSALRPRFESFFRMAGRQIGVEELGGTRIDGTACGVAADGALEVEIGAGPRAGERIRVMAGDVTLAKSTADARS